MTRTSSYGGRPGPAPPPRRRSRRGRGERRGFFRRYWWVFVAVPLVLFLGLAGTIAYVYARTPIPTAPPGAQTTYVYDRHGKLVATLHSTIDRTVVPLSRISVHLQHAVIAIEDRDFYHHGGISPVSILRAAWEDLTHRRIEQGGSTITQQYVKNVYTGSERTFSRKIREAILAVKLDRTYSKQEILERYLNLVYFGNGAYGAEAAARRYWGIPASKLDPLQAATLAALIKAPATYDPIRHPEAVWTRRNLVLDAMAREGYLSPARAEELKARPVKVDRRQRAAEASRFAYFVSYVSGILQDRFGIQETFSGGLRVRTTLDSVWQQAAERAVADHLPGPRDPAAALVAIDPATGEIRALVGGRDFRAVKFNNATQARRQAGSAFKAFTLAAAMQEGISLRSVWRGPPSITIDDPRCRNPDGTPWRPHNYADESGGTMDLVQATAHSVNTIFAQLVVAVGPDQVVRTAHRMGIESPLEPVCSITLGTQSVTPLEMTDAFATLAARGIRHDPLALTEVRTAQGTLLQRFRSPGRRALDRNDADLVTYALQRVVAAGTGTAARLPDRLAAGKTGTTQDFRDAWFCGYVPQLAACVWVGYQRSNQPMHDVEGFANVYGGSIPALIWHDFMVRATVGMAPRGFPTPSFSGYDRTPPGSALPSASPSSSPSPSPRPSPSPSPSSPPSPPSPSPSPTPTLPTPSLPGLVAALPRARGRRARGG